MPHKQAPAKKTPVRTATRKTATKPPTAKRGVERKPAVRPAAQPEAAKTRKAGRGGCLDLVARHAKAFEAARTPAVVRLKPVSYLTIEGRGAPESREFQDSTAAIYGVAYTLKFAMQAAGRDFKVPPLEALWWSDYDLARLEDPRALWRVPRHMWRWRLLILVPEFVGPEEVRTARETTSDKRGGEPLPLHVRFERIDEGTCVQMLHVGPYAEEPESVKKMQALIRERGLTPCGLHHEVYLSDPRRTVPAKLRTILRQPVR